jgi:hypothetical protein
VSGQVAAESLNRENEVRKRIVRKLEKLGPGFAERRPDFVNDFCDKWMPGSAHQHPAYQQPVSPVAFQPPAFDRLNQSPAEWERIADLAWGEHRDRFLAACQFLVAEGLDEEIPAAKRIRGPKTARGSKRGNNSAVALRYVWAAKVVLGLRIKEIAAQDQADPTTVGRIARHILRQASWPWRETNKT